MKQVFLCGFYFIFLVIGLSSCSSKSLEGYHEKGVTLTLSLIEELEVIQSREDLIKASPRLKKLFLSLIKTSVAAHEYQEEHPNAEPIELTEGDRERNEWLRAELQRLYHIEGCRELIEKCEEEALNYLDAYQQQLERRKELQPHKLRSKVG